MIAQLDDTAINIKRGCSLMKTSDKGSCSISSSPMDDTSMFSEANYAEHVAAQNNMEVEAFHTSLLSDILLYDFTLPLSQPPCVSHEEALNPISISETNTLTEPSPPTVILYSTNVLADPSLWDGNFTATSLFGTNKFLNSNIRNIALKGCKRELHTGTNRMICQFPIAC